MPSNDTDSSANVSDNFGNGESYGGATYGTTADGRDVTFATNDKGDTFIADGHASTPDSFWGSGSGKGHDHYGPNGESYADRGKYSDD